MHKNWVRIMNSKLSEIATKAPDKKGPGAIWDNFIELNRGRRGSAMGKKHARTFSDAKPERLECRTDVKISP